MALAADISIVVSGLSKILHAKLTESVTYYKGSIIALDPSTGLIVKAADTAGLVPVGVLKAGAVVGAGENPDCEVEIGKVWIAHSGAAQTDVGDFVYATADDTLAKTAANIGPAGKVVDFKTGYLLIDFTWKGREDLVVGSLKIRSGSQAVTGSQADVDTGLTTISQVFVTVKDTDQGVGDAAYATVDHGADGLVDIYCWDDGGIAATVAATVYWLAIGQ